MKVELVGHVKSVVGKNMLELKIDGHMTIIEVLKILPKELKDILLEDGKLRPGFLVLLNGSDVRSLSKGLETLVLDGDTLTIIPVIHGG
ncbi:MAG: MoaD/ThiS family protein [Thaumarchaeota archaeon]|jgi:molybdopterin converting factor small subunit|nr:MoaD/ThiS family protein [Candidatus Terraquivivens yellowstonensis]MCL7387307.1 MoaD/ThiS family protein [Candidatus Terraquivivens yellowstonensis]MCL7392430.1 MoaD/ThiS family protein [Candidatus Terraquivivens yellowstonensis]MCL7394717.1 MoaD/ThiS family protein [Candidatus Terraquivivens yellowstonensis]MCL7397600.1 MoaD/ThiS family protein [Candidatus Terraquivivens yellowstonensis]